MKMMDSPVQIIKMDEDSMNEFSDDQLDYLQSEFDRQKKIIEEFGKKNSDIISELERVKQSFSYKIGRFMTAPLRYFIPAKNKHKVHATPTKIQEFDPFPKIFVNPDLVPSSKEESFSRALIEDLLMKMNKRVDSSNEYRDFLKTRVRSMPIKYIKNAVWSVTNHITINAAYRPHRNHFFVGSMRFFLLNRHNYAIEYFNDFGARIEDDRARREYIDVLIKMGEIKKPMKELKLVTNELFKREKESILASRVNLLEQGFSREIHTDLRSGSFSGNVMYCVAQSRPFTTNGYAIRTHEVAKSIQRNGRKIIVCARDGYPLDRSDFHGHVGELEFDIEGINYEFSCIDETPLINYNDVFNLSKYEEYHDLYASTLLRQIEVHNPEIIHAASNFVVGMTAVNVARAIGIPSIYEIRGLWHETRASKKIGYANSDHYNISESLEIEVAKRADFVLTITSSIAEILVDYGIERSKIAVLPNCVDSDKFTPMKRDIALEDKYELYDKIVIGYVGSFVEYEGLDILLHSLSSMEKSSKDMLKVLLVGDGPEIENLKRLALELDLQKMVVFVGRVPHDEVSRYYSLIDITPFPRKGRRVCELVSPLKPFEAMAMGKCVIVSDVKALEEFIENGKNGLIHQKDNPIDLRRCIEKLVSDDRLREKVGLEAREWIIRNRTWDVAGGVIESAYSKLLL